MPQAILVGPAETSAEPPMETGLEPAALKSEEDVVSQSEISLRKPGILVGERSKPSVRKNHFLPND